MCKGTLPNRYLSKYKSDELLAQHERSTIEEKKSKKEYITRTKSPIPKRKIIHRQPRSKGIHLSLLLIFITIYF